MRTLAERNEGVLHFIRYRLAQRFGVSGNALKDVGMIGHPDRWDIICFCCRQMITEPPHTMVESVKLYSVLKVEDNAEYPSRFFTVLAGKCDQCGAVYFARHEYRGGLRA